MHCEKRSATSAVIYNKHCDMFNSALKSSRYQCGWISFLTVVRIPYGLQERNGNVRRMCCEIRVLLLAGSILLSG